MAELVPLFQSGDWRRRMREQEEVAVGVRGARPRHNARNDPLAEWLGGNRNGLEPTIVSIYDLDQDLIKKLEDSGRVDANEFLTYHTPDALLHQGEKIDPANTNITSYVNDMARGRRTLLHMELQHRSNTAEARKIFHQVFCRMAMQYPNTSGRGGRCQGSPRPASLCQNSTAPCL